jgi:D-specific alpha-keto acid dehydrogenase
MVQGTSAAAGCVIASPAPAAAPTIGMTIYGCGRDEAVMFEEMAPRFGVMPTITEAAVSAGNLMLAHGNRCISIAHKTPLSDSTLLALSQAGVRHVTTRSIGTDHLDVRYAESVGISVATVAYSPHSVADYTLMLMLMALRSAKSTIRRVDAQDYRLPDVRAKELRDLTVGVIGTGRIGTAVIDRLRGFGCRVLAHDRRPQRGRYAQRSGAWVSLDELIRQSDLVTLHTPLSKDTHHLLDRRRIEQMKPGAYVVNTGRGSLLDTEALASALESGRLGGAALDVLEGEQGLFYQDCRGVTIDNALLLRLAELPNVIVSPHAAYFTHRALSDTVEQTLLHCLAFERGQADG